jgi:hypothetical protein
MNNARPKLYATGNAQPHRPAADARSASDSRFFCLITKSGTLAALYLAFFSIGLSMPFAWNSVGVVITQFGVPQ